MEQNGPSTARKIWHIVKVVFFMLRKGICKRKILLDLNVMMKRSKLAGKAIHNLMFHHHHHSASDYAAANPEEYEFSCSNTPLHRRYFNKKKSHHDPGADVEAVDKVLEMMMSSSSSLSNDDVAASPVLPGLGFGQSPVITRQLQITDSPYPFHDKPDEDSRVDEAAEDFINKFYSQLKQQKYY